MNKLKCQPKVHIKSRICNKEEKKKSWQRPDAMIPDTRKQHFLEDKLKKESSPDGIFLIT